MHDIPLNVRTESISRGIKSCKRNNCIEFFYIQSKSLHTDNHYNDMSIDTGIGLMRVRAASQERIAGEPTFPISKLEEKITLRCKLK